MRKTSDRESSRGRKAGGLGRAAALSCLTLGLMGGVVPGTAGCNKAGAHVQVDNSYAAQLQFGRLQLSESSSLSGGKSTYVDGVVRNMGSSTVQAVTVQVTFPVDAGVAAHVVTLPLTLIRTREPYVDVQSVAADPLLPGKTREFRLVFEGNGKDGVGAEWNQQMPLVQASAVSTLCVSCR